MSFNRGKKRDSSYGNRNFNDRGMGGGSMGTNVGGRNNMGGRGIVGVNPWESGVMPGRGILPTPSNNLSLASPQAQLAIASNLLSNLLRTQQESQSQVPSLLSLGNNFGNSGPNFGSPGQQNFSHGRFNDRAMRQPMKNQRSQPYNKMGNRARDGVAGRRGPSSSSSSSAQHSRASGNQHMNGNQSHHRNDKSSKAIPASKQNQSIKKEPQDNKASDKTNEKTELPNIKSEDTAEAKIEKKRDWQDEKMEAENSQSTVEDTEEQKDDEPVTPQKEETEKKGDKSPMKGTTNEKDGKAAGKKSETRHAESRYAEVPMSHMFCHVCNKHMWDGSSFENHLRGRAHQLMMDKLDESYKLKVDLMRHELRVAEEQRELTLTNSKRRGKKVPVDLNVRDYCTMCDLNFYGTLSSHRKSEKHQQLKTFLHPRCIPCSKEFPSRIEYDEHCLTPLHMKNAVQNEEQRKLKKKDKLAKGEAEVRTAEDEEKDTGMDYKNDKQEDQKESVDDANYLTDIVEELNNPNVKIPNYKYCRQNQVSIGRSMVKEVQGYYCEKCRRFMLYEDDMINHLRTITHYRNFVQEAKILIANAEKAAKSIEETTKEEESMKNQSEREEYDGNWKRRKTTSSDQDDSSPSEIKNKSGDGMRDDEGNDEEEDETMAVQAEEEEEEEEDEEEMHEDNKTLKTSEERKEQQDLTKSECDKKGVQNVKDEKELNKTVIGIKKRPEKNVMKPDQSSKEDEKYDPLEADADDTDMDEEDAHDKEMVVDGDKKEIEENKEGGQGEQKQMEGSTVDLESKEKKDEAVEKMLEDMDDTHQEARNLIDDTGDEKVDADEDTANKKTEESANESIVEPEPIAKATPTRGRNFYRQRGNRARRSRR